MPLPSSRRPLRHDAAVIQVLVFATLVIGIARMVALAGRW